MSRITSCRSDSSFAVRIELSLVKPSSQSFLDLEDYIEQDFVSVFKLFLIPEPTSHALQLKRFKLVPRQKCSSLPWACMYSSEKNSPGCRWITCNINFICNVTSPENDRITQLSICQCPFKQAMYPMLGASST